MPPLLGGLSRIDLTNCSEDEARRRLIEGVHMPAPPELKPAFEKIEGEAPDSQHAGPAELEVALRGRHERNVPRHPPLLRRTHSMPTNFSFNGALQLPADTGLCATPIPLAMSGQFASKPS